ncbi:tetratricopeptide repeat protein [Streptomyces mangrovisoli]|uniref:Uncharacterized protein n=1 Tax=Streptomyces mangrovisoli TaxID=1428628 RepID=A0A1J4NYG3_9ACTN|nr:tetratricopeptide repeat protein [Streptomyces mangrovisoli]OIJ66277.1 hypothetical protein WN71_018905 [Streptomyces mangrovisoli]
MSPRTNDSEPEDERIAPTPAGEGAPTDARPEVGPASDAPTDHGPAAATPTEDEPTVASPAGGGPAVTSPAEDGSVAATPAEDEAVAAVPAGDGPAIAPPAEDQPAIAAPAEDQSATAAPVEDGPVAAAPADGGPVAAEGGPVGAPAVGDGPVVPDPAPAPAQDERVVAVRRFSAAGRRWRAGRAAQLAGCALLLAVALTGGAIAVGAAQDPGAATVAASSDAVSPGLLAAGNLDASIAAIQAHLRTQPKDFGNWATLGLAYVEQARTKGDPSRYPQAAKALKQSLKLAPDNDQALAGQAALAAARHQFADALGYADRALAQDPYSERALSSRVDALVELGRYAEASKAADLADTRRPGVPVFTRYAYVHELSGDVTTARRVLRQALDSATSTGDVAYVAAQLGQLAWNQGDYKTALSYYARALAADDNYLPALEGRARAQFASGDHAAGIKGMELVVSRYPLPGPLVELGEMYESRDASGDPARARDQYALVDAWIALARANGVNADLDTALAAADHGDKAAALRAARAEWARRHTVHTADALAWALHVNGHDTEALGYARRATATGYHNASFLYHRGMIELATHHTAEGRASLTAALKLNPGFSPLGASTARAALKDSK